MSARIVLLAAADFTDYDLLEAVLDKTRLAVEEDELPPLFLKTLNRGGAELHARRWWLNLGLHVEPSLRHPNLHVVVNSLITDFPEAVLLFGTDKYIEDAAVRAARLQLHVVRVGSPVSVTE